MLLSSPISFTNLCKSSQNVNTQRDALRRIIALAALCPDLQEIFRRHQGMLALNSVSHLLKSRRQFISVSDNAHLLSESRRAMMFMEENERNAVGKLVVSSVPTWPKGAPDNIQLWYTHVRRLYFQCVDKRSECDLFCQYQQIPHIIMSDDQNICLFQCDILLTQG